MALKIRLQRHGSVHSPMYRIVVAESSARRNGRFVENLGYYNPKPRGKDEAVRLNTERAAYWMSVGAKPTDTVRSLIREAKKTTAVVSE
ncbi:MAG: 30S ribosomal protein S16 [Opitutales bacterium]